MADRHATLVLLRHGESEWNALNLFTGWVDVDLTDKGRAEAVRGGELIKRAGRAARRAVHVVAAPGDHHREPGAGRRRPALDPGAPDWRLNERHYGALQGLDKAETKAKYGDEQFMAWRRSYDTPPPPIEPGSEFSQDADPRYADIDGGPLTECLDDVVARFVPYFTDASCRTCGPARRC